MSSQQKHTTDQHQAESASQADQESHFIGDYATAPEFMKDNDHITHGYRINFNTPSKIIRSLFMLHNESVNIWSHCIPAIFILFFLLTFYVVVDSEAMRRSFHDYHRDLQNGLDHYMDALDNLSLLAQYDKLTKHTHTEMHQLKQTVMLNYQQFINKFHTSSQMFQNSVESEVEDVKSNIRQIFKLNMAQFQRAKRQFELKLAPLLVQEISERLNTTWFHMLKEKVDQLKREIDSDDFQILQLHQHQPNPHQISRWPIGVFLATAIFCLLTSTIFHLFYPMSSKIYLITNRFDYAGINILISGSMFPTLYYGMYCQLDVAIVYLTFTLIFATVCFVVCLFEWIHRPENKKYKGLLYAAFGGSLIIPVTHLLINELVYNNYGDKFQFSSSIPYFILLGASYLFGVYIYVAQCPERSNPGKYNMCGHSHQIWHGFVLLGIFFTYLAALQNFEMRKLSICPA